MIVLRAGSFIQMKVTIRLQPIVVNSFKQQPILQCVTPLNCSVWCGRQYHHLYPWESHHKINLLALQNIQSLSMTTIRSSRASLSDITRRNSRLLKMRATTSIIKSFFEVMKGWTQARRMFLHLLPKCTGMARDRGDAFVVLWPGSTAAVLSIMAWIVLPNLLRRMYKYMETAPTTTTKLLLRTPLKKVLERVPYELSMCGALEDPARLLAAIIAFSHIAYMVAPTTMAANYLKQTWSGATVVCVIWFLYRWKTNVIARIVTGNSFAGLPDKERYLTMDHLSSLGLLILGCMAVAEACGMAVQSIMTVGGIGGVATAFAAKDVMGNMLCGVGLQFFKPFSIGDAITAGPVTGQVVEMGLHSTLLLNAEKFPIMVPNSFFSSQVIVNKSRVQWRGMAFTIPIRLQDLDRVPAISVEVRKMLTEHPKVFLETELPRCHASRVCGSSVDLNVECNLKPMGTDEFLTTEQALLIEAAQIVVKTGALLGSDTAPCSLSRGF